MNQHLSYALVHHEFQRERLMEQFPDIDDETLRDTLEGLTDLNEIIVEIVRSRLDDLAMVEALRSRVRDMQERQSRLEARADNKKAVVVAAMERAGLSKLVDSEFTVSLRSGGRSLVITDEERLPGEYWKAPPPKLDRQALTVALRAGQTIAGAALSNGVPTISVRTK